MGGVQSMAKRRKRTRREDWDGDAPRSGQRRRGRRGRRFEAVEPDGAAPVLAEPRSKQPVTCYQCAHLVMTRSFVKHVSQSWDRAVVFPTLTCFQQRWTLEDPDSVHDPAAVIEYLVQGADGCPDFVRGYPRGHDW